jgi:hypothetical protein
MPSEHLRNVRFSWVFLGWFTAVALASFSLLVIDRLGLLDGRVGGILWGLAVMVSFLAGGFFAGYGVDAAPDYHAIGIALVSVVIWVVAALLARALLADSVSFVSPLQPFVLLGVQALSAVLGARLGVRARRR